MHGTICFRNADSKVRVAMCIALQDTTLLDQIGWWGKWNRVMCVWNKAEWGRAGGGVAPCKRGGTWHLCRSYPLQ